MHTECHVLGLFPQETWQQAFAAAGLCLQQVDLDGAYDRDRLGDGQYPLKIFIGRIAG